MPVFPSEIIKQESSMPFKNSSITTFSDAFPNFFLTNMDFNSFFALSISSIIKTPFPPASPSALRT